MKTGHTEYWCLFYSVLAHLFMYDKANIVVISCLLVILLSKYFKIYKPTRKWNKRKDC